MMQADDTQLAETLHRVSAAGTATAELPEGWIPFESQPQDEAEQPKPAPARWPLLVFLAVFAGAMAVHLYHLNHLYIAPWDEVVHAVVAEHVELHPLVPTLYEYEALPPPTLRDWASVHIFMHIPPFGMWAAGLSMRMLGDTPFALRLPGVFFVAIGMISTFLLGRRLFGQIPALVGAFVVGFAPLPLAIAQGYAFGDITDTPLLGLTPLLVLAAVYGWQTGKLRWLVVAGIVQGCLYLTKNGLALAPVAVILALFLADLVFRPEVGWNKLSWRGLVAFAVPAALIAEGFNLYFNHAFPQTMAVESRSWLLGLTSGLEGWGRSWDFHLTVYFYLMYGTALALLLIVSVITAGVLGLVRQSRADVILFAWAIGLYLPISIAVSKTPSMGMPAVACFGLAVGRFFSVIMQTRNRLGLALGLGVILSAAVTVALMLTGHTHYPIGGYEMRPTMINPSTDYLHDSRDRWDPYKLELFLAVFFAAGTGAVLWLIDNESKLHRAVSQRLDWLLQHHQRILAVTGVAVACVALGAIVLRDDIAFVTRPLVNPGPGPAIGPYIEQHSTANTTIFIDDSKLEAVAPFLGHDQQMVMFWSHRDTYTVAALDAKTLCPLLQQAAAIHSPVVIVTQNSYGGTMIGTIDGWSLYQPMPCSAIAPAATH
jgi:4-amino-4-deoxy-L-arabinose transferase-like glycosyltransferase